MLWNSKRWEKYKKIQRPWESAEVEAKAQIGRVYSDIEVASRERYLNRKEENWVRKHKAAFWEDL